jgi:hypothetical protein
LRPQTKNMKTVSKVQAPPKLSVLPVAKVERPRRNRQSGVAKMLSRASCDKAS